MNKKVNTLLFIAGATLFNIIVTVLSFFILLIACQKFIMRFLPDGVQAWTFALTFMAAIALSFVVYRLVLGLLFRKIDMEKYFHSIISGNYRHR